MLVLFKKYEEQQRIDIKKINKNWDNTCLDCQSLFEYTEANTYGRTYCPKCITKHWGNFPCSGCKQKLDVDERDAQRGLIMCNNCRMGKDLSKYTKKALEIKY